MIEPGPKKREETGTATASVADELVRMILGHMAPGASLPSEAELAIHHGVSRVTVREAVKMVAGKGLLDLARGRRAVVREPDASALGEFMHYIVQSDPRGVFDLVEDSDVARGPGGWTWPRRRATRPALAAIEQRPQGDARSAGEARSAARTSWPSTRPMSVSTRPIALASGNRILMSLFEAMAPALRRSFFMSRRGTAAAAARHPSTPSSSHQRILQLHQPPATWPARRRRCGSTSPTRPARCGRRLTACSAKPTRRSARSGRRRRASWRR